MIKIKRIYELPLKDDGYRILVDRLWPRGLKKDSAAIVMYGLKKLHLQQCCGSGLIMNQKNGRYLKAGILKSLQLMILFRIY
nr:DUF488 family protein [uncultured Pedobacter sp.]